MSVAQTKHTHHDSAQIVTSFSAHQRDEAYTYADQIGGFVTDGYNEYGAWAVWLPEPDGKHVPIWSHIIAIPKDFVLRRRGDVRDGDEVISSHYGRRTVVEAVRVGSAQPGTSYLYFKPGLCEGYPSDAMLPVRMASA